MTALLSPRIIERAGALEPSVRRAAGGRTGGDRPSGAAGAGIVFHEHRAYTPGDDLRYVDWNAYGRLRSMQVKTFEREDNLDLHVLLDASASMGRGDGSKMAAGARAAGLIGASALARGDVVRLQSFPAGEVAASAERVRPFAGRDATGAFVARLGAAVDGPRVLLRGTRATLGASLRETFPELRRRGAAVLVTDFLAASGVAGGGVGAAEERADDWRRAIDFLLHRRVELTCVHVVADDERHPRADGPMRLADAETGDEIDIDLDDAALAEYSARFERHLREVAAYLRGRGARHILVETGHASESEVLRGLLRAGVLR